MRDADRTIERLLAGLRDAEPPGGMERRILEALSGAGAREVAASVLALAPAVASSDCNTVGVHCDSDGCFYCPATQTCTWTAARPTQPNRRLEWGTQHFFIPPGGPKTSACAGGSEGSFARC